MQPRVVRAIRKYLGLTQVALARVLGVSAKAVQSHEQGWRAVPAAVMGQLLVLLAIYRQRELKPWKCWEITRCPPTRRKQCPAFTVSGGMFCWLVSGRLCEGKGGSAEWLARAPCASCPVLKRLLPCRLSIGA